MHFGSLRTNPFSTVIYYLYIYIYIYQKIDGYGQFNSLKISKLFWFMIQKLEKSVK